MHGKGSRCCRRAYGVYASTAFHVVDALGVARNSRLFSGLRKIRRRVDVLDAKKAKLSPTRVCRNFWEIGVYRRLHVYNGRAANVKNGATDAGDVACHAA